MEKNPNDPDPISLVPSSPDLLEHSLESLDNFIARFLRLDSKLKEFLSIFPSLETHELEAYCDATLIPAIKAFYESKPND